MPRRVCVYCAASQRVDEHYRKLAEQVGARLAQAGYELVYGGGDVGLMGALARSVHRHGGRVVGVIPEALQEREGIAYELADALIVTQTLQERKAVMFTRADAFLVLPGGFGTLEEFMEVLTLRQLGYHHKPILLLNYRGFFDLLLRFFERLRRERFVPDRWPFAVASTPDEAFALLERALAPTDSSHADRP